MQPDQPMTPGVGPVPPPPGQYGFPYVPTRPSGPSTLGTLSIVFGAIVVVTSFFSVVAGGTGMMGSLPGANTSAMHDYLQAIRIPSLLQSLMYLAMSGWLIAIGLGQRRYRAWAARQSVLWGTLALVFLVGTVVLYLTVIGPAAGRMMDEVALGSHMPRGFGSIMRFAGIAGTVFYAPYPIILIATFRQPRIVSAMNT